MFFWVILSETEPKRSNQAIVSHNWFLYVGFKSAFLYLLLLLLLLPLELLSHVYFLFLIKVLQLLRKPCS
jgi:hypothetical protein